MKRYAIAIVILAVTTTLSAIAAECRKGPIVPKEKIALWNGKDFAGWKLLAIDPEFPDKKIDPNTAWSIKDGVICCKGMPFGYIRTEADYANYHLHVEWRWTKKGGNSGIFIHASLPDQIWPKNLECQLMSGDAGDFILGDGVEIEQYLKNNKRLIEPLTIPGVKKLKKNSEKPIGQWNACDVICMDDWVVVLVNGVLQNVATRCSVTSGKIALQSEGQQSEFRNVYIEPVE